jgi:tripartite-type tricarboxylate transporter receptor subunit TctC
LLRLSKKAVCLLVGLMLSSSVRAQTEAWPSRAITIVGGFPNGAGTDLYARKLGEALSAVLGVSIVVDSKTGAGGNLASDFVARAQPDGYTFLMATAGTHAINAALYKKLSFDVERDFTHVAILGDVPNVLLINTKKHPTIKTCAELLTLIRANPGKLNFGTLGAGGVEHLKWTQIENAMGYKGNAVAYKGGPDSTQALLGGEIDCLLTAGLFAKMYAPKGQVRVLGVFEPTL